jgi:ribosomal protein S18 acetylase RimI-like enzyme
MDYDIRPYQPDDLEAVLQLSIAAWAPVFASFEAALGSKIFLFLYPDWQKTQRETVEKYVTDETYVTVVAEADGLVVGFLNYELREEKKTGEVMLLAVHPDYQNEGIGTTLNLYALDRMKEAGMELATVGTGGDEGHAPARVSYEKAGYTPLPVVQYYKSL